MAPKVIRNDEQDVDLALGGVQRCHAYQQQDSATCDELLNHGNSVSKCPVFCPNGGTLAKTYLFHGVVFHLFRVPVVGIGHDALVPEPRKNFRLLQSMITHYRTKPVEWPFDRHGDDLIDLSKTAKRWALEPATAGRHSTVVKHRQWKSAVAAYLACIHFVNSQIGLLSRSAARDVSSAGAVRGFVSRLRRWNAPSRRLDRLRRSIIFPESRNLQRFELSQPSHLPPIRDVLEEVEKLTMDQIEVKSFVGGLAKSLERRAA